MLEGMLNEALISSHCAFLSFCRVRRNVPRRSFRRRTDFLRIATASDWCAKITSGETSISCYIHLPFFKARYIDQAKRKMSQER